LPIHNAEIAKAFDEIADLLELDGANPFRVRAYRNAARVVGELRFDIATYIAGEKPLPKLPGIGADLAAKIHEIVSTGSCALLERLRKDAPAGITDLLRVPGLGPKRVRLLWDELGVHTVAQLQRAAQDGRVRGLSGFGPASEAKLLDAARAQLGRARRFKLAVAADYAVAYCAYMRAGAGIGAVVVAGSYRRMKETVGDLDLLVIADNGAAAVARFVGYDEVAQVLAHGGTRASVVLRSGLQVDLRVVPKQSFGAALYYFTGSKAHNIAVRLIARQRGLKINEYGVFRRNRRIAGETEESVFAAIGLPYIPPELRENQGEIEAAQNGELPVLVEASDLRGDLHAHTHATDGKNTLAEMADAARRRGLKYLAITEHSRRLGMTHGLDAAGLARQIEQIDRLNARLDGITLLKGIEVDILEDGSLDLEDPILAKLDLVVGAVHSRFNLSRQQQTARILAAMDRPCFSILAHPTGRLIDSREPYDVDMLAIARKARSRGIALELNAHPERLDLTDVYCRMARDEGVAVSIASDAHSVDELDNLAFGVGQARRGWLTKRDVLNTLTLPQLRKRLAATMRRGVT
jgi:DNA polymerase (family 10)